MSDEVAETASATPIMVSPKKTGTAKKPAKHRSHPPATNMVLAAVAALKDKKGSSLQAIKKYIVATYKCDIDKQSHFIQKYLKSAVEKRTIVQTKGFGASGRFKLAGKKVAKEPVASKKPAAKKPATEKKKFTIKPVVKKIDAAKRQTVAMKTKTIAKPKTIKAAKLAKSSAKFKKSGNVTNCCKTQST